MSARDELKVTDVLPTLEKLAATLSDNFLIISDAGDDGRARSARLVRDWSCVAPGSRQRAHASTAAASELCRGECSTTELGGRCRPTAAAVVATRQRRSGRGASSALSAELRSRSLRHRCCDGSMRGW